MPKYTIRQNTKTDQKWEYYLARLRKHIANYNNIFEQVPNTPTFPSVTDALKWGKAHSHTLKRWRGAVLVRPVAISSEEDIEEIS